jgi:glycosyltransferase involved in cell wall biosynthesis
MSRHVLFIHPNFPAQFGHVAAYLAREKGFRCTFVSEKPPGLADGVERIQYRVQGGATESTHYFSRTFENAMWHSHAIYEALRARRDVRPDLIVAHSGFLSSALLRELYACPIVNYFEYFYHTRGADMDFRPDFPATELNCLRARARNANLLLDLENCDIGYSPTRWQQSRFPAIFQLKIRKIFDGVDTRLWRPNAEVPRVVAGRSIPDDIRIVTYCSRGMESMRGFDIFMKVAKLLCDRRKDVLFVIVGEDRVCYGGDQEVIGQKSFKDWVLSCDSYDLSRFFFTGLLPPAALAHLFAISDLHIYLTVPFVLSWSLMNALACGTTVLASDTAPVQEMIRDGENGLLEDFFDIEGLAERAAKVLDAPQQYRDLGRAGVHIIQERYSLDVCLPHMLALYEDAFHVGGQTTRCS